jgi:uncharacterized membrane protein YbhN (UPF0104 family)
VGKLRKKGLTALKALFSVLLLYLVFTRIPFSEVWVVLKKAHPGYLALALIAFGVSKWIAARRLNLYFERIEVPLTEGSNLKLYLLGMFYNLFLPGGIGGDAYKGYLLHRTFGASGKRLASVLLLDRISGLVVLFLYSAVIVLWMALPELGAYQPWLWSLLPLGILVYWAVHRKVFPLLQPVFWSALGHSALVQLAQLVSVYLILLALGVSDSVLEYLLVFLISSIVAVLPITIGGIGSRELVFFYGAQWLGLNEGTSIGISMTFFLITALVSLSGLIYHFRKPQLELRSLPGDSN